MEPVKHGFSGGSFQYTLPNQPIIENSHNHGAFTLNTQSTYPQAMPPPAYQGYPAGNFAPATSVKQTNTTVIVAQPNTSAPVEVVNNPPPNFLALSVMSCLFCFWPIGLVAIMKSMQVDAAVRDGNLAAANQASRDAKRFAMYSIGAGAIIILMSTILRVSLAA